MPRLLLVATFLLVVWGALAFGAVYPWAWQPLIAGCATAGAASWLLGVRLGARAGDRPVLLALTAVVAGAIVQIVPLPRPVRMVVSPALEAVLVDQDLGYALAANPIGGLSPDAGSTAVTLPSHPLSINPGKTIRGLVILIGLTGLLGGLTRLLNLTGTRRLCTWLMCFGVALALIGIIQRAVLGDHAWGGMRIYGFWKPLNLLTTPFGPFVNRNHFAGWMLMALPLSIGLAIGWASRAGHRQSRGWRNAVLWLSSPDGGKLQLVMLAMLVMGVSLVMTKSRSGVAAFVAAILFAGGFVARRFDPGRFRWVVLATVAVLLTAFAWAGSDVADRFASGGGSIEIRQRIWRDSVSVVRDFPLVGTGLNTFGTAMLSYQTSMRGSHFQEAHNDFLQVLVEGGLLLAIPTALAMFLLARAIRQRFALGQDDTMAYWLRVGATTGLVAIGVQSLVEFSLQMPGNAVFCVVLMAIALHESPTRSASRH